MFLLPLLQGVQRNPFKQTVVSHPFPEWRKVSNNVCTRVTLMGLLDTPDGTAEKSHGLGQQKQWQSRAVRAKSSTDCATALTLFTQQEKQIHCIPEPELVPFLFTYAPSLIWALPLSVTHLQSRLGNRNCVSIASHPAAVLENKDFCLSLYEYVRKPHFLQLPRQWRIAI